MCEALSPENLNTDPYPLTPHTLQAIIHIE